MASSSSKSAAPMSIRPGPAGSFQIEIKIAEYPRLQSSPIFSFGGYSWCLKCNISPIKDVLLSLQISGDHAVKGTIIFCLLGKDETLSTMAFQKLAWPFPSVENHNAMVMPIKRNHLEDHLTDDWLTVHCFIFLAGKKIKPYQISNGLQPDGLVKDIGNLLKNQDNSDVTLEVDGQFFHAHKLVLAARSSVFKAELFGPMVEAKKECIKIEDMNSEVFRVLLHYIYTDCVEAVDTNLTQHLLEAADRYALDALRIICEEILCENLTLDTVLSSLALADQHNCDKLLDACLDFAASLNNLVQLTVTQEYLDFMKNYPDLFAKFRKKTSNSNAIQNLISKRQRIV